MQEFKGVPEITAHKEKEGGDTEEAHRALAFSLCTSAILFIVGENGYGEGWKPTGGSRNKAHIPGQGFHKPISITRRRAGIRPALMCARCTQ